MLTIDDLHVRYGTTHAVRGINLTVGDGEAVALLGPNGAGKSSTLRAISRQVGCSGTVRFEDADLAGVAPEQVARRGIVHVPEGRRVFRDLTVHENLMIGTTARGGRPGGFGFDEVYDLFPALVPLRNRLGYALSGGEQQMTAIGRGLVAAPKLMLIDEPSLGLAPVVVEAVADALVAVRGRIGLLVIEQNVHVAVRVCERAAVLSGGRIVMEAPTAGLGDRDALLASYLGQKRTGTMT
jgi:branched-chain amino acid transport system ATP-binding protein